MSSAGPGLSPPQFPSVNQILPAEPLLLMGAGPVPVPAEVARAGSLVINHLGATTDMVVRHIKELWCCRMGGSVGALPKWLRELELRSRF